MRYLLPLLLLLGGCGGCASVPSHNDLRATALRLEFNDTGVCSGTAVSADTFVTATHCARRGLKLVDGKAARAVSQKDIGDLSLVRLDRPTFEHWIGCADFARQGQQIRWFGNAARLPDMYRQGYVVQAATDEVYVDATAYGGDSGAGVLTADGCLIGVVSRGDMWVTPEGLHMQLVVIIPMPR